MAKIKMFGIGMAVLALVIIGAIFFPVHRPHVVLPAEVIFHIAGFPITNTMIAAWIAILVLAILFFLGTRKMRLVPTGLQNVVELVIEMLYNFVVGIAGEKNGRRFFPVVATIFLCVIANALLALFPGFHTIGFEHHHEWVPLIRKAGTDINFPLAIALVSGLFGWFYGIRIAGPRRFFGEYFRVGGMVDCFKLLIKGDIRGAFGGLFPAVIDIFIGFIELLSHLMRTISFTFRLFGNMTAGEVLVLMMAFLIPWVVVSVFYGLEIILGFVQALIFAGLTLVFVTMAVSHDDEHE